MSDRPTPETAAAVIASNGQWSFVLRETCERLERERDEARSLTELNSIDRLIRERDEAREALRSICTLATEGYLKVSDHRGLLMEISDIAREEAAK
jgi:hypothetical protein